MKIAIFSDCYLDLTGGIVSSINNQKEELERLGHTVYVFSSSYKKTPAEIKKLAQKRIYPVPSCRFFGRGLIPIARRPRIVERWLLKNHPEIKDCDAFYVHYEAGCSIAGLRLGRELGVRTVQVMHGREDMGEQVLVPRGLRTIVAVLLDWFHSWYLPHPVKVHRDDYLAPTIARANMWTLMVNHANYADLVLAPSAHFRAKLKHYGVAREIKVLPNGVPDAYFVPDLQPRTLSPGEPLRLIWHSRISSEKSPLVFLAALRLLKIPYHVDIYGEGVEEKRARRYADKHRLDVTFHGVAPFKNLYRRLLESHLDVLVSSGYDTFGMTLVEAESAGVPTLYVDPDMDEIIPAHAGVRASANTPEAIAAAITDFYDHPDRLAKMSAELLRHRDQYRISKIMEHNQEIFHGVAK